MYIDYTVDVTKYISDFISLSNKLPIVSGYSFKVRFQDKTTTETETWTTINDDYILSATDSSYALSELNQFTVRLHRNNISETSDSEDDRPDIVEVHKEIRINNYRIS